MICVICDDEFFSESNSIFCDKCAFEIEKMPDNGMSRCVKCFAPFKRVKSVDVLCSYCRQEYQETLLKRVKK